MIHDVDLGPGATIPQEGLVNLYGCRIGAGSKIAAFVEIQRGVVIGRNVKVEAFAFICSGVTIDDGAFVGPHVCFTNDKHPRAVRDDGELATPSDWTVTPTKVGARASIGAGSVVLCGISIGEGAVIGAGSVVTRDVPAGETWRGEPARRDSGPREPCGDDW